MAFDFSTLVTDRTLEDVSNKTAKGFYNATDLNRVGEAVRYLAERFTDCGYAVTVNPKTDWTEDNVPTRKQLETYRRNIAELRRQIAVMQSTPETPATIRQLDYIRANNIEQILVDLDRLLTNIEKTWYFSGELYAGEV
jgi:hypothetical protein